MSVDLDATAWTRLQEAGGRALIARMIELFLQNTPGRLSLLRAGVADGDWASVERAAHSMKSSAAHLGLRDLRLRAEQAEALARDGRGPDVRPLLEGLDQAFALVRDALPGVLGRLGTP